MKVNIVPPKPVAPVVGHGRGWLNLYIRGDILSPGEVLYPTEALATKNIDQPDGNKGPRAFVRTTQVNF